jgi:hypothetical protein
MIALGWSIPMAIMVFIPLAAYVDYRTYERKKKKIKKNHFVKLERPIKHFKRI